MNDNYLWWLAGSVVGVAGAALFGVWTQRRYEQGLVELVPAQQRPESWVVDRPTEVDAVVRAVISRHGSGTVGITTALQGAGGFGKTTVARLVRADRRVLRRFGGRVFWVTLGRDVRKEGLLRPLSDLFVRLGVSPAQPFTDVRQAADYLASVLESGPRRLLILDDVWFDDQLAAFPVAGRCARLVTTRKPSLVAGQAVPVRVDQMSPKQARRVLTEGLTGMPSALTEALLRETGRWPLLLRLVNRNLHAQMQAQSDVAVVANELLQRLRRDGPLKAAGHLPEVGDVSQLDIGDPDERSKAVSATIEASMGLLPDDDRARLAELAIFAEDETVPVALIAALWRATGEIDQTHTRIACARLNDLALLTLIPTDDGGMISLHDVVRDYLHEQLADRVAQTHGRLLDAVAANLPSVAAGDCVGPAVAWWQLPERARYLREHLVEHLCGADRTVEAEAVSCDLRWVQSRLQEAGPVAPFTDLSCIVTSRAARLSRLLAQAAHLLTPTDPPHCLPGVLYCLVGHDPDWGPQSQELAQSRTVATLRSTWPMPDLPDPAVRRVLTGHVGWVSAVAIAPDGTWLATASDLDGSVRLWDAVTGAERGQLTGHGRGVSAVAIAPDGTWLATVGGDLDGSVRLWDAVTGAERGRLTGGGVSAVAIAPDGTWLATASRNFGSVRLYDAVTGAERGRFTHGNGVSAVAIAPDGTWLATIRANRGGVRLWDAVTGAERGRLTGGGVSAVAIAPDSTWLAVGYGDGSVRLWDAVTGTEQAKLRGHDGAVSAVAIAPDGTWLATASRGDFLTTASKADGQVRLWDTVIGAERGRLTSQVGRVSAVAIAADGAWLAAGHVDGSVRLWDAVTGTEQAKLRGHDGAVSAVAIAPDGTWLATIRANRGGVRLRDAVTGAERIRLTSHTKGVNAVAIAPDSTWLAVGYGDGSVRLCDAVTGAEQAKLRGHDGAVSAVAIAPNGTWLATASKDSGSVRLLDAVTGTERGRLTHGRGVSAVAIAPDGTWLATASEDYGSVRLWDAVTGTERATLGGHGRGVSAVAIAPDGTWLATAGKDYGSVRLWDAVTGTERATLGGHGRGVSAVAIAPDSAWLATISSDGTVRISSAANARTVVVARTHEILSCCAWSPRGYQLFTGGKAGLYRFEFKPASS